MNSRKNSAWKEEPAKRSKSRVLYDKDQLDKAVSLVIKNKLSLRAASVIYNIPFSSLRTRKIYLCDRVSNGEDLQSILSATNKSEETGSTHNENLDVKEEFEDCQDEEEFEDCQDEEEEDKKCDVSAEPSNALGKLLQINQNPKSKQRCSLAPKFKSKRLMIKMNKTKPGRIIKRPFALKQNEMFAKEKPNKRIYITHDKLENLLQLKAYSLLENQKKENGEAPGASSSQPHSPEASNSPAPVLSDTLISIDRNSRDGQKSEFDTSSETTLNQLCNNESFYKRASSLNSSCKSDVNESMLNSLKKHLRASSTSATNTPSPVTAECSKPSSTLNLYKCSTCDLMFIDKRLLIEHRSFCCETGASSLLTQLTVCHSLSKQDLFKCPFCTHSYANKFSFMSHVLLCSAANSF